MKVKMDRLNVAEASIFDESADEACVIPSKTSSENVATSNPEFEKVENYWKYLISDEKKDRSLHTMEYDKSNEPGEVLTSSNESHSTVTTELAAAYGTSNMSNNRTNSSHNQSSSGEEEEAFDNNLNMTAGGSQQANKVERRRKSVIFTSKRKPTFSGADSEEFDDSGVVLNNSNDITSPVESDSAVDDKMFILSESPSGNHNTPHEVSMDSSSKNDDVAPEKLQSTEVVRRKKLVASKRKLSSRETEDLEFDESGKKANKRGRGRYKLRDLSSNNSDQKKPTGQRAQNKSTKRNFSQADTEEEVEDSAAEEKTDNYEAQKKDKLVTTFNQATHNREILKLINEGSPAKLRTLSRVGLKTAMMIHQYRKLNGKLKSIQELENMSGWSPKFFELFLLANNIVLD